MNILHQCILARRTNFRVSSGKKIPFYMSTGVLRKNLDLTQINYEALIHFNVGVEKYPNYACVNVKQLQSQVPQVSMDFHPPNKFRFQ